MFKHYKMGAFLNYVSIVTCTERLASAFAVVKTNASCMMCMLVYGPQVKTSCVV